MPGERPHTTILTLHTLSKGSFLFFHLSVPFLLSVLWLPSRLDVDKQSSSSVFIYLHYFDVAVFDLRRLLHWKSVSQILTTNPSSPEHHSHPPLLSVFIHSIYLTIPSHPSLYSPFPHHQPFLDDLRACVNDVLSNPSAPQGNAAIYGMTSSLPPGPVNDLLKVYNDVILKLWINDVIYFEELRIWSRWHLRDIIQVTPLWYLEHMNK